MREFNRLQRIDELNLTPQEKLFAERWLETGVKTQAAKDAGYTGEPQVLRNHAVELSKNPRIAAYMEILKEDAAGRVDLRLDRVLKELMRIGFSRMDHFVKWSGGAADGKGRSITLRDSKDLTEDDLAAVSEITQTDTKDGTKIKIKLYPKQPSLDRLLEFVADADGLKKRKPGEPLPPGNAGAKRLSIHVKNLLINPDTRAAFEKLAAECFREGGQSVAIPKMTKQMKAQLMAMAPMIEYEKPEGAAEPVETAGAGDNEVDDAALEEPEE